MPYGGGANGSVTIALSVIPVVVALSVVRIKDGDGILTRVFWNCLAAIGIGLVMGLVVYRIGMHGIVEGDYIERMGSYSFLSPDKWTENIALLPRTWIKLFLTHITEGVRITSPEGLEILFSLGVSIVVGLFPWYCLCRYAKLSFHERFVLAYGASVWIVCLMQFVLLRGPIDRLIYNGLLANFLLLGIAVVRSCRANTRFTWFGPPLALLLALWCVYFTCTATWKVERTLINELEARGLRQGCATYWGANGNTVLAEGKVRVAPIFLRTNGQVAPRHYDSDASWYSIGNRRNDCFMLLDPDEWNMARKAPNHMLFNLAKDHFESQGFHVLVYSGPHWQKMLSGKIFAYNFNTNSWSRGCTSGNDRRLVHKGGVSFGPRLALGKEERCNVRIMGRNLGNATISVCGVHGERIYLQPEYTRKTDSEILFSFVPEVDLEHVEVAIRNRSSNEDVVLTSEILDATNSGR